jgi:hypothetical protein
MSTQMINIGTAERPIFVPEKAFLPQGSEGREWWEALASGSIILSDEALDLLLKKTDENR